MQPNICTHKILAVESEPRWMIFQLDHVDEINQIDDIILGVDPVKPQIEGNGHFKRLFQCRNNRPVCLYTLTTYTKQKPYSIRIMYTKHIQHISMKYGLNVQLYADDTQLYIEFQRNPASAEVTRGEIENCIVEIKKWMCFMSLKLNEGKTKLLFLNKPSVESNEISSFPINACSTEITGVDWLKEIKSLGVFLDEHFNLTNHISYIRKYCFGQLMSWKRIAPSLTEDVKLLLVKQIILSKVDYCNSLFAGLPDTTIQSLQSIVNCAIRFIYNVRKRDHITPYIMKSHILPVKYRIDFKVCTLVFNCLNNSAPEYLKDLVKWNIPSRPLDNGISSNNHPRRTQDPFLLEIPTDFGNRTRYRSRCFSHYAPRCWNKLPYELRSHTSKDVFSNNLKTYFFNLYVSDSNIVVS